MSSVYNMSSVYHMSPVFNMSHVYTTTHALPNAHGCTAPENFLAYWWILVSMEHHVVFCTYKQILLFFRGTLTK